MNTIDNQCKSQNCWENSIALEMNAAAATEKKAANWRTAIFHFTQRNSNCNNIFN